jgi:hypothetical protein
LSRLIGGELPPVGVAGAGFRFSEIGGSFAFPNAGIPASEVHDLRGGRLPGIHDHGMQRVIFLYSEMAACGV